MKDLMGNMLFNCEIEGGKLSLLESMPACPEPASKLRTYFTVNLTNVNYFDKWTNSSETLV